MYSEENNNNWLVHDVIKRLQAPNDKTENITKTNRNKNQLYVTKKLSISYRLINSISFFR